MRAPAGLVSGQPAGRCGTVGGSPWHAPARARSLPIGAERLGTERPPRRSYRDPRAPRPPALYDGPPRMSTPRHARQGSRIQRPARGEHRPDLRAAQERSGHRASWAEDVVRQALSQDPDERLPPSACDHPHLRGRRTSLYPPRTPRPPTASRRRTFGIRATAPSPVSRQSRRSALRIGPAGAAATRPRVVPRSESAPPRCGRTFLRPSEGRKEPLAKVCTLTEY